MIARTRSARHRLIVEMLARETVRSQSDLAELLATKGVIVTQATLSRDLVDIGAVKVRGESGPVYAVPGESVERMGSTVEREARLRRICTDTLVSAAISENLVVLRTPPGAANFLASAIDTGASAQILATVAGDDTVLVVAASRDIAPQVARYFLKLAGRLNQEEIQ